MKFEIRFTPGADRDLDCYDVREQRIVLEAIEKFLRVEADIQSKRRKRLRTNPLAPWELRVGDYRIFYEIRDDGLVRVLAVGHKEHNILYIRGKRIEICEP